MVQSIKHLYIVIFYYAKRTQRKDKECCKDKSLMVLVRKLVTIYLYYNIVFNDKHIPGVRKKRANSLSRSQVHTFTQLPPLIWTLWSPVRFPSVSAASELGGIGTMHASSSLQLSSIWTHKRA